MWAILSDPSKKGRKWDSAAFFQSGEAAINHLFAEVELFDFPLRHGTALDFGCGLGRLTQGICKHFDKTYGIDISPTMVAEATRYNRCGLACEYVVNDSTDLSCFGNDTFDFICSSIVLQHIRPEACKLYLAEFVRVLKPEGLLFFQLPSAMHKLPADTTAQAGSSSTLAPGSSRIWMRMREIVSRRKASRSRKLESVEGPSDKADDLEKLIEMHGIPREEVCNLLERANATVLRVQEDDCCGLEWASFRYWVTKASEQA